jgi:hypothetical protein
VNLAPRDRVMRRTDAHRSPEDRLVAMAQIQARAFALLDSSPEGRDRFLRRNLENRRAQLTHGTWEPISPARRAAFSRR